MPPTMTPKGMLTGILALILTSTAPSAVRAADSDTYLRNWPQWRGPSGNGLVHHGNPPLEWSESKNVKYKVKIPGAGHATPVIWDDTIFILTAVPGASSASVEAAEPTEAQGGRRRGQGRPTQQYEFTVICLDRKSGEVRWQKVPRKEVPHEGVQESNSYSSSSPLTDGERLYAYFGAYGLYCYDFEGNLIWEKDLGQPTVKFGAASSPALAGEVLVVVQDSDDGSFIYGFDKKTGRELWKKTRDEGPGWTTPHVLEHEGTMQVLVSGSNAIRSYDPKTGEVIWECSGLGSNPVAMIVSDEDTVYAMSGHREPAALAIALGRTGNLTGTDAVKWRINRGTPYVPSPLLHGNLLFFCQRTSGTVTCVDADTGKPHYEQERLEGINGVYGSPIGVNNRIYLPGQNGIVLVLENSSEIKVLANNKLDDGFDASPAVVGDELFLRGREHLYCIAAD